jgi:DNA polymerase III gamma/tau subunit
MTMRLYEKHRPATLADIVGQDKAVGQVRGIIDRGGFGGRAVWVSGGSGTGKTSLARIIAGTLADPFATVEYDSADQLTQAELEELAQHSQMFAMGKGGRAWIVNESHALRRPIVRQLLGILERLPEHCCIILTTTREGQDQLFEDDIDAGPLLSRCLRLSLTSQGLARAFAERVRSIAQAEGLDGQPMEAYVRLAQRCKNNCRQMLMEVESGAMLGGGAA